MEETDEQRAAKVNGAFVAKVLALRKPTKFDVEWAKILIDDIPKEFILRKLGLFQPDSKKE